MKYGITMIDEFIPQGEIDPAYKLELCLLDDNGVIIDTAKIQHCVFATAANEKLWNGLNSGRIKLWDEIEGDIISFSTKYTYYPDLKTFKDHLLREQAFRQVMVVDKGNANQYFLITKTELDKLIGDTLKHIHRQINQAFDKLNNI